MKPVAFLRNTWRRKKKENTLCKVQNQAGSLAKSSPPSSLPRSNTGSKTLTLRIRGGPSTTPDIRAPVSGELGLPLRKAQKDSGGHSLAVEGGEFQHFKPKPLHVLRRTRSRGTLHPTTNGPLLYDTPGPPHTYGQPNLDASPLPSVYAPSEAVVPPRPLHLYPATHNPPALTGSFSNPGFCTNGKSTASPIIRQSRSHSSLLPLRSIRAKRSMPELDGTWKGFLEDVEEDYDSLGISPVDGNGTNGTHHHSMSISHISDNGNTTTATSARWPQHTPSVHAALNSAKIPEPLSVYPVPPSHLTDSAYVNAPLLQSTNGSESQIGGMERPGNIPQLSLPALSPLIIRKKIPHPLVLRTTPSIARLPPSPVFSTPNSTCLRTPPTPRSLSPQLTNNGATRKPIRLISILKKPSSRGDIEINSRSPPITPLPSPPHSSNSSGFAHAHKPSFSSRPLRLTQSVSHLPVNAVKSTAHRATMSASARWSSSTNETARGPTLPHPATDPVLKSERQQSYLVRTSLTLRFRTFRYHS